jgi:cation diffusion facilitator CzcD-associated flavoprotein CzcO
MFAYCPPGGRRPLSRARIAIIGTGFSGLGAAIQLKRAGIDDFVLLERADDLGGTWHFNHYPGLCCDVPSHVYSFSFDLSSEWTRGFAPGWEIKEYLRANAEKHGLMPHIRFGHEVLEAAWDEEASEWNVHTSGGDVTARYLVNGSGALSEPKPPDIPGLDEFRGHSFHSGHWDHDHDLTGERVGVVGTGASSIQFVPKIQPQVSRLSLFQRTPPWIIPRFDHEITEPEKQALRRIPLAPEIVRGALYWTLETRVVGFRNPPIMKLLAEPVAKWHMRRQVKDPALREKLTPDYTIGCKRILISDDYYPSLDQPNVDVVTEGIERVTADAIVTRDGARHEVDTIIFGTGFEVTKQPIARRIRGRGGQLLADAWSPSIQAYKGTTVAGFPNMFQMTGPNTGLGHNSMVFMVESQLNYIVSCFNTLRERGAEVFEVKRDAQDRYNEWLQRRLDGTVWTAGNCQSWYLDDTGRNTTLWPSYSYAFRRLTRSFDPQAYELAPA